MVGPRLGEWRKVWLPMVSEYASPGRARIRFAK
jgi:hypothetical protein